jgi:hypothetical protein
MRESDRLGWRRGRVLAGVAASVLAAALLGLALAGLGIRSGRIAPPRLDLELGSLRIQAASQITCLSGFRHDCDGPYFVVSVQVRGASQPRIYTLIRAPIAQAPQPAEP